MDDTRETKDALHRVMDPLLGRSIVELGVVADVARDGTTVRAVLAVPTPDYPYRHELGDAVKAALEALDGVESVEVEWDLMDDEAIVALLRRLGFDAPQGQRKSPFSTGHSNARVIAVASGKGGVGKSSVTTNLAVALARLGAKVGVLDADVWGFSVPRMLGVDRPPVPLGVDDEGVIIPPVANGVSCVSIGFFVDEDKPIMWRGPMLHKAMEQFLGDVYWGDLDYLVIDMPPGTGDISLSMAQMLPDAEMLVVTTPQAAAQRVAQRAGKMAEKVNHRVIGVVENMSWLELPGGDRLTVFGEGGGQQLADDLGAPLLAQVPLDESLREGADTGHPVVLEQPESPAAKAITALAEALHAQKRKRVRRPQLKVKPA